MFLSNQGDWIRTSDLVDPNHTLYQAELHPGQESVRAAGQAAPDLTPPARRVPRRGDGGRSARADEVSEAEQTSAPRVNLPRARTRNRPLAHVRRSPRHERNGLRSRVRLVHRHRAIARRAFTFAHPLRHDGLWCSGSGQGTRPGWHGAETCGTPAQSRAIEASASRTRSTSASVLKAPKLTRQAPGDGRSSVPIAPWARGAQ